MLGGGRRSPNWSAGAPVMTSGHTAWGRLPATKLERAIDAWIDRYDPGALRRTCASARSRDVCIGDPDHEAGTAALWGRLLFHQCGGAGSAADADGSRRVRQRPAHPRPAPRRRAGRAGRRRRPAGMRLRQRRVLIGCRQRRAAIGVVIHVVAAASALDAHADPHLSAEAPAPRPITAEMTPRRGVGPRPRTRPAREVVGPTARRPDRRRRQHPPRPPSQ